MDDEYYYDQEAAMEKFIEESLKDLSTSAAKSYLAVYGDAIDSRVRSLLLESRLLHDQGVYRAALINSASAIEIIVRFMVLRPLIQGAFLSDEWAAILSARVTMGRTAEDRKLLPAVLRQWGVDIEALRLVNGLQVWQTIHRTVWPIRNRVVHQGSTPTADQSLTAIACAEALRTDVVGELATRLGLSLERTGQWARTQGESGSVENGTYCSWSVHYDAKSPFDDE